VCKEDRKHRGPRRRRDGGLPQRPFCQPNAAGHGVRAADHPGDLREAVQHGAEEQLQRRRGYRGSRVAVEPSDRFRE